VGESGPLSRLTKYEKILFIAFLFTLPLSNPWVRGDGVGYYAFARSMLIEHRLDFTKDWLAANTSFRMGRLGADGQPLPNQYTVTGHLDNHFSVGPAILWSPFLIVAHIGVVLYDHLGGHTPANGYSRPYLLAMAVGTAMYGFLALMISFAVARRYVAELWAFLATLGIWFASSLPVYMYFNPSWSHAQSAFTVALFVWYWTITRNDRSWGQWAILGAIGGLMLDVYYLSGVLLLFPLLESLVEHWNLVKEARIESLRQLAFKNVIFGLALAAAVMPSLVTKRIIYGSYLKSGYEHLWVWNAPALFRVCFSPDHGLFSWTPILIPAVVGLWLLRKYDLFLSACSIGVVVLLLYTIGCYADWDGISSFGNRFFVLLTPLFILGLAAFFDWLVRSQREGRVAILACGGTMALIVWNLGLIFQWGMHLIPDRGPISWREAAFNQVTAVPDEAARMLSSYLLHREELMNHIEENDVKQINKSQPSDGAMPTP
jgi:hypothetical protein